MTPNNRNNVHLAGDAATTMVFAHGFGCDQTMWRYLTPAWQDRFNILTYDLTGSGDSDLAAYDRARYGSLLGHADDLLKIIDEHCTGPVVFVGHSVSAMIGMLASIAAPERFAAQVMIGPSPCYINDDDYIGGFTRADIESLLASMDEDFVSWSYHLAPAIMGAPNRPDLSAELTASFCDNDPGIARHFGRVAFLSDHRADVLNSTVPALIMQCSDDLIAPRTVGQWLRNHLPNSQLAMIGNVGHCPHMSAPGASADAIDAFLARALL